MKSRNDNWYRLLVNKITSCDAPEKITKNDLNIITFNCDVSLDYYLYNRLNEIEYFKKCTDCKESREPKECKKCKETEGFIKKSAINEKYHLYGKLHEEQENENSIEFSGYGFEDLFRENEEDEALKNTVRLFNAYRLKDKIKTIYGDKAKDHPEKENISKLIREAEEIYIIGFGFDVQNQNFLGFPESLTKSLSKKSIYWHNWRGEYQSLERSIKKKFEPLIYDPLNHKDIDSVLQISHAETIERAWQNDFFTRLKSWSGDGG